MCIIFGLLMINRLDPWEFRGYWQLRSAIITDFCTFLAYCLYYLFLSLTIFVTYPGFNLHVIHKLVSRMTTAQFLSSASSFIFILLYLSIKKMNVSQFVHLSLSTHLSIFHSLIGSNIQPRRLYLSFVSILLNFYVMKCGCTD